MTEGIQRPGYFDKIANYDKVEIYVNDKVEIEFEGVIDPVYIQIHFQRVLKTYRDFDIVKMIGYCGKKSKELITEVIIGN